MIGRPDGGSRPVAVSSLTYRIWGRVRRAISLQWEQNKAGFWDTAVRGSSALQAALKRHMKDEIAVELNIPFVTTLSGARMETAAIREAKRGTLAPLKLQVNYQRSKPRAESRLAESGMRLGQA